jgi:hypothetical protein
MPPAAVRALSRLWVLLQPSKIVARVASSGLASVVVFKLAMTSAGAGVALHFKVDVFGA